MAVWLTRRPLDQPSCQFNTATLQLCEPCARSRQTASAQNSELACRWGLSLGSQAALQRAGITFGHSNKMIKSLLLNVNGLWAQLKRGQCVPIVGEPNRGGRNNNVQAASRWAPVCRPALKTRAKAQRDKQTDRQTVSSEDRHLERAHRFERSHFGCFSIAPIASFFWGCPFLLNVIYYNLFFYFSPLSLCLCLCLCLCLSSSLSFSLFRHQVSFEKGSTLCFGVT